MFLGELLVTSLEFIEVIPDDKLDDLDYITEKIQDNRKISIAMRNEIREYGIKSYSLLERMKEYVKDIENIIG